MFTQILFSDVSMQQMQVLYQHFLNLRISGTQLLRILQVSPRTTKKGLNSCWSPRWAHHSPLLRWVGTKFPSAMLSQWVQMAKVCPINCFVSCTTNHSYWSYVHQVSYLGGPHCKRWQFSSTISMPIFIPSMKSTNSQGAQALDWLGLTPELLRESDYQVLHSNKNKHQQFASSKLTIDVEWCGFSPHHLNHNCHFPFPAKPRFPHGLFHLSMVFSPRPKDGSWFSGIPAMRSRK